MGGQLQTPGKANGQQQVANADPAHATQIVGKSTLIDPAYANAGIESGGQGRCSNERGEGCFLNLAQRIELNSQLRGQLALVAINYAMGVEQCRVDELIKKIDELPWYASLLLGAAISVLEAAVPMVLIAFKTASKVATSLAQVGAKSALSDAEKEFKTLTAAQVSSAIKSATALGKTNAVKSFTAASSDQTEQANAKQQALKYTNILNKNAMIMWSQTNIDIGSIDDAAALALLKVLNPDVLTVEMFRAQCAAALARYAASNVSKIGREADHEEGKKVEKEIRVARLIPAWGPMFYVYQDRVFDGWYTDINQRSANTNRSGVYDDPQNAFSLNQEADWTIHGKEKRGHETPIRPDKILNRVEPEFVELAIAKQKAVWLTNIETFHETWINGQHHVTKVAGA